MNKYKETFGVDISKAVFDVQGSKCGPHQFSNSPNGFRSFLKLLPDDSLVVMEATGYYHYRLSQFLCKNEIAVSVVNPLSVKRFIEMKLSRVKTDKSDAQSICDYGIYNKVPLYNQISAVQSECRQLLSLKSSYLKRRTSTKNKLHGERVLDVPSKLVVRSLLLDKKHIDRELVKIEKRLLLLVKQSSQRELTLLKSIPGIGDKTAVFLIVATDSFRKFSNASQLCSYLGTTPMIKRSGSSVRGRSRISKMGNRNLRNLMFMCSMSAYKHNRSCKAIHDRIVSKGKSSKLALMAVCNKLIHQAFAIVRSGVEYNPDYVSVRKRLI
ncbi:IS110 family transposase [Winogradskyella forsetii]|uniref:IS110 family transposase n=1 Tax=Winogradskyella forsetii TaxID=2686077 RepID=UPI0015B8F4C7|nr:IS110 family transposase [Winogradskyella forsetii]